jgi:trk system potassium uptake protein TrkH
MQGKSTIFSPSRMILISVIVAIAIGTTLLSLPIARTRFIPLIDLVFTATSSICVTGFMTIPMESFTQTGQIIIMLLIQIGGLGLITLTLFAVSLFMDLGLATQVMAGEMLDLENWSGARRILLFIICLTLSCEFIGACILFQTLKHHYPFGQACFYSIFQSISAFCNSGLSVLGDGIQPYSNDYSMLCTMSTLMVLGGVGFITIRELINRYNPFEVTTKKILSLQTRVVLSSLTGLICINTIIFWLLERQNTFAYMTLPQQLMNALFTSISSRSSGFLTVYANDMQLASLFSFMVNAFIGSGPGSTGSGIKITTAAIFAATINAAIRGKTIVNMKGRRLMQDQINKALAVVALSILWISLITFCLLITERSWHFIDILFESVGAFTTLGISIGITPYLSIIGKLLIIVTMFIGRIGSLTLLIALRKRSEKQQEFTYPQERVMIS